MRMREAWRALSPFSRRLAGSGGWFALGMLLLCLTLIGSLGLLGVSGWFLTGAAIAGLSVATAQQFNYFPLAAGVRFFAILRTVSRWGERVVTHEGTFRQIAGLRVWLYERLSLLSPGQLGQHHGGALLGNLIRDVDALDNLYPRLLLPTLGAVLTLTLITVLIGWQMPWLIWLGAVLIGLSVAVLPLLAWRLGRNIAPARVVLQAALRRHLLDCIDGLEDFSLHRPAWLRQRQKTLAVSDRWLRLQLQFVRYGAWLRALVTLCVGLAAWAALGLGYEALVEQKLSGPWLIAIVLLLLGTFEALQALPAGCLELPGTAEAAARLNALSDQRPHPFFIERGERPETNDLSARNLRFDWHGCEVFSGLNLDIPDGEHVAILGHSGGGKSTLVGLLARLEEPSDGHLYLGGVSFEIIDEHTLRQRIACAGQSNWAQTATLADNLRLADPEASEARMREILTLVGLDETVAQWRDGLNTWVEEGGASLSGGQRRRLGIVRALLRNAPITILDEPTEGLDATAERELIERLHRHLHGRTLIWITHRRTGLELFDRVLRLEAGRLGEGSLKQAASTPR